MNHTSDGPALDLYDDFQARLATARENLGNGDDGYDSNRDAVDNWVRGNLSGRRIAIHLLKSALLDACEAASDSPSASLSEMVTLSEVTLCVQGVINELTGIADEIRERAAR